MSLDIDSNHIDSQHTDDSKAALKIVNSKKKNKKLENGKDIVDFTTNYRPDWEELALRTQELFKAKHLDFIFLHDLTFNLRIKPPYAEAFDVQVSAVELVQELNQLLMDREDTCMRTCFTLKRNGETLDNFAEIKSLKGLKEGEVLKVVEEPYTVRDVRIHIRHIRDLLKVLDPSDAYIGQDGASLSFTNVITQGDVLEKDRPLPLEKEDCFAPEWCFPFHGREPSLTHLHINSKEPKNLKCVEILTPSGWNPPPGYRKLQGDLMYLYVMTCEGKPYHITASVQGFYINKSTDHTFDPHSEVDCRIRHSLIDLLSLISNTFKRNFALLQKKKVAKHPLERAATPFQVYTWIAPQVPHSVDFLRAEDSFSHKLGYEEHIPGQTRDWNEELQTTLELPTENIPKRLTRERAFFKVYSDFVTAATRGAMSVIDRNIMAINPGEDPKMHMFIWNNIFFSLGFDVRDHFKSLGGDAAAHVAPLNDLNGVRAFHEIDIHGLHLLGTVVVDYRGYRVTAQSIIPGILEREQDQSVVYGSVDFGKTVVSHKKYVEMLEEPARILKIMKHKVYDSENEPVELNSSLESKGIIGNDGRHYVLDLLKTFPPDVNFMDLEGIELCKDLRDLGFPIKHKHNLSVLRRELVDVYANYCYWKFIKSAASGYKELIQETLDSVESSQKALCNGESTLAITNGTEALTNGEEDHAKSNGDNSQAGDVIPLFTALSIDSSNQKANTHSLVSHVTFIQSQDSTTANGSSSSIVDGGNVSSIIETPKTIEIPETIETTKTVDAPKTVETSEAIEAPETIETPETVETNASSEVGMKPTAETVTVVEVLPTMEVSSLTPQTQSTADALPETLSEAGSNATIVVGKSKPKKKSQIKPKRIPNRVAGPSLTDEEFVINLHDVGALHDEIAKTLREYEEAKVKRAGSKGLDEPDTYMRIKLALESNVCATLNELFQNINANEEAPTVEAEVEEAHIWDYVMEKEDVVRCEKVAQLGKSIVDKISAGDEKNTVFGDLANAIEKSKNILKKAALESGSLAEDKFDMRFNPDLWGPGVKHFQDPACPLEKQQKLVIDAATYLVKNQIPLLIKDCIDEKVQPIDGVTLREAMHEKGINVRYLGKLAEAVQFTRRLDYLLSIIASELITRSAKHIFVTYIQNTSPLSLTAAISHFLNCMLSNHQALPAIDEKKAFMKLRRSGKINRVVDKNLEWTQITSVSLWNSIKEEISSYFGYKLEATDVDSACSYYELQRTSLLRSFCLKTGVQIMMREYSFKKDHPTFNENDILNVLPIVKHSNPRATDAKKFYDRACEKMNLKCTKDAYDMLLESLNLMNNVYGALHPDIAHCMHSLAKLNYVIFDYPEALSFQQRATIMSERIYGYDHAHTLKEYMHLGLYLFTNQHTKIAVKVMYRARYLALIIVGENHPVVGTIDATIGIFLQVAHEYEHSTKHLERALLPAMRFSGSKSVRCGLIYHLIARNQSCIGDFRAALSTEKEAYAIFKKELGEGDRRTIESNIALTHLTQQAVCLQKRMNDLCRAKNSGPILPIHVQPLNLGNVVEMLNQLHNIAPIIDWTLKIHPLGGASS